MQSSHAGVELLIDVESAGDARDDVDACEAWARNVCETLALPTVLNCSFDDAEACSALEEGATISVPRPRHMSAVLCEHGAYSYASPIFPDNHNDRLKPVFS